MDTTPRTQHLVRAEILTSSYRVVGKISVSISGVSGLLNDPNHSHIEVQDARLARMHIPVKMVDHYDLIRMTKRQIVVIALARREDLGTAVRARNGFGLVTEYPVRLTTQVYEIEGRLACHGRFDFSAVMTEGTQDFIPIFDATLTAILFPALSVVSPVMLFNRTQLDLLGLVEKRPPSQS